MEKKYAGLLLFTELSGNRKHSGKRIFFDSSVHKRKLVSLLFSLRFFHIRTSPCRCVGSWNGGHGGGNTDHVYSSIWVCRRIIGNWYASSSLYFLFSGFFYAGNADVLSVRQYMERLFKKLRIHKRSRRALVAFGTGCSTAVVRWNTGRKLFESSDNKKNSGSHEFFLNAILQDMVQPKIQVSIFGILC